MPAVAFPRAAICLLDRESETARPDNEPRLTAFGSARGLAGWGLVALQPDASYVRGAGELSIRGADVCHVGESCLAAAKPNRVYK